MSVPRRQQQQQSKFEFEGEFEVELDLQGRTMLGKYQELNRASTEFRGRSDCIVRRSPQIPAVLGWMRHAMRMAYCKQPSRMLEMKRTQP